MIHSSKHNTFIVRWCWTLADIQKVIKELNGANNVLHICSGSSGIGDIRLDRRLIDGKSLHLVGNRAKTAGSPNILGDMFNLPFKSGSFKNVIIDPPYDPSWVVKHIYREMLEELVRVTMPAGKIIIIAQLIFCHNLLHLDKTDIYKTGLNNYYYKTMASYTKINGQIEDYLSPLVSSKSRIAIPEVKTCNS